jgi:hypothetical protein
MMMNRRRQTSNALSGIQTHGLAQAIKAYASDRMTTGTGLHSDGET